MRYDDEAYKEVFPRVEPQAKTNHVESACETFKPSEDKEQLNNEELAVEPVNEEVDDGVDGNDIGADS